MIDLTQYRIIDFSVELLPGERKINGDYLHGEPLWGRPVEIQEFIAYNARMHHIQMQTHTGTHAESAYKYFEGPDLAQMPIETYLGEAVACNLTHKQAGEAVTAADFRQAGVKAGDIVLAWGSAETAANPPYFTTESVDWLIETKIKMLGIEYVLYQPAHLPHGPGATDYKLLQAGIPMIDAVRGLDQIKKTRVFFISLPVKMRRVSAFPTRAIALEEKD